MAVNSDIVANDLFKTIKGFNLNVQLFNEDGKVMYKKSLIE